MTRRWTVARLLPYALLGVLFGITASQSQIVSWYRIQEMFRFDRFHMFGVMFSAVAVASLGVAWIRRAEARSLEGEPVVLPPKSLGRGVRYAAGGTLFGIGWGLAGVCPGPIFVLLGHGIAGAWVALAGALVGTWVYSALRSKLPH